MKNSILALAALTFILTTAPAMAAGARVPRELCFNRVGLPGDIMQLAFKSAGTLSADGSRVKHYGVNGTGDLGAGQFPIVGNAYVIPATTVFHATLQGAYIVSATHRNAVMELFLDLVTGLGNLTLWLQRSDGTQAVNSTGINLIDCKTLPVNGLIAGDGNPSSSDQ